MTVLTLSNPKHFKWLRLLMASLKTGVHFVENDWPSRINPNPDETDGSEYVTPREINTLTLTDTGAFFHSVDERLGWVFVKTYTYAVGKSVPVKSEEHQYFRTQAWIDKTKIDFDEYLADNPSMRVWGADVKKTRVYELLPS